MNEGGLNEGRLNEGGLNEGGRGRSAGGGVAPIAARLVAPGSIAEARGAGSDHAVFRQHTEFAARQPELSAEDVTVVLTDQRRAPIDAPR